MPARAKPGSGPGMRAIEQKAFPIGRMSQALASCRRRPWRPLSALWPYEVKRGLGEERVKMERARASWGKFTGVLMRMVMIRDAPSLSKGLGTIKKASAPCGDSRLERDYT